MSSQGTLTDFDGEITYPIKCDGVPMFCTADQIRAKGNLSPPRLPATVCVTSQARRPPRAKLVGAAAATAADDDDTDNDQQAEEVAALAAAEVSKQASGRVTRDM